MLGLVLLSFALITGLKCVGEVDPKFFVDGIDSDLYFSSFGESIERSILEVMFKNQIFSSDDDAVKVAMFFLVSCFFLASKAKDKCISTDLLKVIDNGRVEGFAWGKLAFDFLLTQMKSAANTLYSRDSKIEGVTGLALRGEKDWGFESYKLGGLAYALQVCAYECIPDVAHISAKKSKELVFPRMAKVAGSPT